MRAVELQQQADQRGLAHAAGPDNGHVLAGADREGDVFQDRLAAIVGERDVPELDLAAQVLGVQAHAGVSSGTMSNRADTRSSDAMACCRWKLAVGQKLGRAVDKADIGVEGQQRAERPLRPDDQVGAGGEHDQVGGVGGGVDGQVGQRAQNALLHARLE